MPHPAQADDHDQPGRPWGWQRYAARACDQRAFETHLAILFSRTERCCCPRLGHMPVAALQSALLTKQTPFPPQPPPFLLSPAAPSPVPTCGSESRLSRRAAESLPGVDPRRASTTRSPRCRSRAPLERRVPPVPPYPTPVPCPMRHNAPHRPRASLQGAPLVECAVGCPAASRRQLRAWSLDHAAAAWCARRAPVG